jgi:DNA-directed RNA polymerase specialized sigma24 family protein
VSIDETAVARNSTGEYQKLLARLTAHAVRMGSIDPEAAAQEAVNRSLADHRSREAVEYFFHEQTSVRAAAPEWGLLQLVGWLHGVLRFVVLEERAKSRVRRETAAVDDGTIEPVDPAPSQLDRLIEQQHRAMVRESLTTIDSRQRAALLLRLDGAKYADIAAQLSVSENTVATWLRRGSQELVQNLRRHRQQERRRAEPAPAAAASIAKASHA